VTTPVIAIAGSTGQVALALMRQAAGRQITASAFGRPRLDLASAASIEAFLDGARPDIVINAAAYTAVDKAESEPQVAHAINAEGPAVLAAGCAKRSIPLIHISTDYVFDGTKTSPYIEDDAIAPLGVYGRSKADGEEAVRRLNPQHVIVRTSWVYGPDGANFLKTMLRLAAERDEVGVVGDQHGAPTRADDLAAALLDVSDSLLKSPAVDRWGTYHLAGGGQTTWHGFAAKIFQHTAAQGLKTPRLKQIATADYPTPARRPAYSVLDQAKIGKSFGVKMPNWSDSLARHFANLP
jgi:dTDP-4-dehydrorhamnose reductase